MEKAGADSPNQKLIKIYSIIVGAHNCRRDRELFTLFGYTVHC